MLEKWKRTATVIKRRKKRRERDESTPFGQGTMLSSAGYGWGAPGAPLYGSYLFLPPAAPPNTIDTTRTSVLEAELYKRKLIKG